MTSSVITLTTDFGTTSPYISLIKGAIICVNPVARWVDVTHDIGLGNVFSAAYILGTLDRYFPQGTVHLAVVDTGVGSARNPLIIDMGSQFFVGPDNGLVTYLFHNNKEAIRAQISANSENGIRIEVPSNWRAYQLDKPEYWNKPISSTVHGRDIFAPVAAQLSLGLHPSYMGSPVKDFIVVDIPFPNKEGQKVQGEVIHIDSFGNIVFNITEDWIHGDKSTLKIQLGTVTVSGINRYYAEKPDEFMVLINSAGYLELAYPNKHAAELLHAHVGQSVQLDLSE